MSWATIRTGMKTRLATISGLTVYESMAGVLQEPNVAVVLPGDPLIEPSGHGGVVSVNIRVVVRCRRGNVAQAQAALDGFVWPSGATSIAAAVGGDPDLGGVVDGTRFVGVASYGFSEGEAAAFQADVLFRATVAA